MPPTTCRTLVTVLAALAWGCSPDGARAPAPGAARPNPTAIVPSERAADAPERAPAVRIRVVDADGREASSASLAIDRECAAALAVALSADCGAPGTTFAARDVPPHRARRVADPAVGLAFEVERADPRTCCAHLVVGDVIVASAPLAADACELVLRADPALLERAFGPIDVLVTAADVPLPDVRVRALLGDRVLAEARTAADGRAQLARVPAGDFTVQCAAPGFATSSVHVRRPVAEAVVVALRRGFRVEGLVVGPDGAPRGDVPLRAYDAAELGRVASSIGTAFSAADGTFAFEALAAQEVLVCVDEHRSDRAFLPPRGSLPRACTLVAAAGGARDVVVHAPPRAP